MSDVENRLRAAMHAAVDGEEASAGELIRQVRRRHRGHNAWVAGIAALVVAAAAVPAAIAVHGAVTPGTRPSASHSTPRRLPATMSGLPMPAGTTFRVLITTLDGAAWYSTATRRTEPITGLPASQGGYAFSRVEGGFTAAPTLRAASACHASQCAGPPLTFYFIADGSAAATRIGAGYEAGSSSRPGALWLVGYPRSTDNTATTSATAQLVSTAGQPLGPQYRLPAGYLVWRGAGADLVLSANAGPGLLWDPGTGRTLRRFVDLIDAGPEQIVWTRGCRTCRVQVLNVQTGKDKTTPIPGNQPSSLTETLSDDGTLLAVQLPGRGLAVLDTGSETLTVIPGTALSSAESQNISWQNGGHRLIITAGPGSAPGPVQVAYWQPGDTRLMVATARNQGEISVLETGRVGT